MQASGHEFEVLVLSGSGEPVAAVDLASALVLDMEFFPPFAHKPAVSPGRVKLPAPDGPFAVSIRCPVEGFGHVFIYADNEGQGYRAAGVAGRTLDFCLEAAASRTAAVSREEARLRAEGLSFSAAYEARATAAREALAEARGKGPGASCAAPAMRALAAAMHAGELLVVEEARQRIARQPARKGFCFGCNAFSYVRHGEPYAKLFSAALNFATLPFYRGYVEKAEGQRDFSNVEKILEWTAREGLPAKGHPLVWENYAGLPPWLRGRTFAQICAAHRDYIRDAVGRFRKHIHIWDVINEAHDWANDPRHSLEEMLELTRLAAEATGEADSRATRVVNSCCTWSEYVASQRCSDGDLGRPAKSVLQYVRDVLAAGIGFEVIGIQMYYPSRDLFEISRHLDLFCRLGKPVHITELGVPSSAAPRARKEDIHTPVPTWHGPWSEQEQADWIAGYYTLCYAKPAIEAITWWDFSEPAWYPHGGLVGEDLRPKESYRRMEKLIRGWTHGGTACMTDSAALGSEKSPEG